MSEEPASHPATDSSMGFRRRGESLPEGRRFWKSLEEYADTDEFRRWLDREFPVQASEFDDPEGRRQFLKVMGASLALAGLTACTRQPAETIVPYVKAPEQLVPGKPLFYATAIRRDGYARGVLVESHMGRPTKIEGNPEHPASLGATDAITQAEILSLYDPDRSQTLKYRGEVRPWSAFTAAMHQIAAAQKAARGAGVRILTEGITSPSLAAEIQALKAEMPDAAWHVWEPVGRDQTRAGTVLAFGEPVDVRYKLEQADVIVSLDADFMCERPDSLPLIRSFVSRRRTAPGRTMNRLYAVESTPGVTGGAADHRLALRPSEIEGFARALAAALLSGSPAPGKAAGVRGTWVGAIARDLREHAGRGLVMAGESQPPVVHAIAHALNEKLGNVGQTVFYTKPVEAAPADGRESLRTLVADMNAGKVSLLMILGGNPVYTAPADVEFLKALQRVETRVHLGLYDDETAAHCHWHLPAAHDLESWGDARAFDGTVTIVQPLIEPLYGGRSPLEVLATLSSRPQRTAHEIVREYWAAQWKGADFERAWRKALHDGVVADSAVAEHAVAVKGDPLAQPPNAAASPGTDAFEIVFRPDPTVYDGRYANNGWLQELPKPLTKLTWDNAALVSVNTAKKLQVKTGDVVKLTYQARSVTGPVYVLPGQPDGAVTVHLGYGRTRAGQVAEKAGFSAYALRTLDAPWSGTGAAIEKTGETAVLAITQDHWSMEGRPIVRVLSTRQYEDDPEAVKHMAHEPKPDETLYPAYKYDGHAWGMAIDLSACIGCNACIVACQAENNIPVVGRDQVARGREMHWLRVDRYFSGDPESAAPDAIDTHFAPIPCMHCENAPCEVVCPVAATVHSDEGLNDMVYNRCVGTKYCSNNCPYKVRRFNFFLYQDWDTPQLKLMRNPDVTVRSRGVMEKCTYCVQRINSARITAKNENRAIRDGDIRTACAQACPAEAIVFGDINDPKSEVSRWKGEARNYGLLAELNTRPRTTYLATLKNWNPEIPRAVHDSGAQGGGHHG